MTFISYVTSHKKENNAIKEHNWLPITENQTLKGRVKARIKELEVPTATSLALPMAQHARKDPCTAVQADAQKPEDSFLFQA